MVAIDLGVVADKGSGTINNQISVQTILGMPFEELEKTNVALLAVDGLLSLAHEGHKVAPRILRRNDTLADLASVKPI